MQGRKKKASVTDYFLFLSVMVAALLFSSTSVLANEILDNYVTVDRVNLRKAPSLDAEIVTTADIGVRVAVESLENGWYQVVYKEMCGYMKAEYLGIREDFTPAAQGPVMEDPVTQAAQGPIIEEPEADTSASSENPYLNITIDRVNLRTAPSLDAEIIATVNPGFGVVVQGTDNGWHEVVYNNAVGYMKAEYIGTQDELTRSGSVELADWSEAKGIFTIGVPAKIQDVRTGLVYYVKSFSNGNHADVETVTTEDTAAMLKAFNGAWSWDTRPIWVTINGRTMAASISGMPHGGGVNSENGVDGQFCIHFKGSTTHNGNKSHEQDHQAAVMEAYNKYK